MKRLLLAGIMALALAACSMVRPSVPAPTPAPPSVTAPRVALATLTPMPSATLTATPTPSPTLTPSATATPTITATATREPSPTPWPTPSGPLTTDERALLFDETWQLINDQYIDPNFNGLNWAQVRAETRPRALAAPTDESYYEILRRMVQQLGDQHSRFMSPSEAFDHFAMSRNELSYGGLGLYTLPLPDGGLVLQVMPNSPAARAGVQACDRVTAFNGGGYWGDGGDVGTTATVDFFRPGVGAYQLTLTREEIHQVITVPAQILPGYSRRIAYARVDTLWVRDMGSQLRDALAGLEQGGPLDGLILDLRSNQGGWRPTLQALLGLFVAGDLGEFSGRRQTDQLFAPAADQPAPPYPTLPLVLLVSDQTESYAEVLAAVLQAERGAVVIGEPTRGNVETIFPRRLPFSARVWIAEQGFRLRDGRTLEGIGVQPDVLDRTDWTRYACAQDPQVAMAAQWLMRR